MGKHYATITIDDKPFLSYLSTPGRILSPMTMPWRVVQTIGDHIFGEDHLVATNYNPPKTEQLSEHVFRKSSIVTLINGRAEGPSRVSYVDCKKVDISWEAIEDYS